MKMALLVIDIQTALIEAKPYAVITAYLSGKKQSPLVVRKPLK